MRITPADDMRKTRMRKLIHLLESHLKQMAKKTKRIKILPKVQKSRYLDILEKLNLPVMENKSWLGVGWLRGRCKIFLRRRCKIF